MKSTYLGPVRNLFLFSLLVLFLSQAAISLYAWSAIEQRILPELGSKAATVGTSAARKIQRAVAYQIPFEKITGVPEFFDDILQKNPDIAFLVLCDARGRVMHASGIEPVQASRALRKNSNSRNAAQVFAGSEAKQPHAVTQVATDEGEPGEKTYLDTSTPVVYRGQLIGALHTGVEQHYLARRISELRYDIGIILLTSLLIAFEILQFLITRHISAPIQQMTEMMEQMAASNFRNRLVSRTGEQLDSIAEALNVLTAKINQSFQDIVQLASIAAEKSASVKESWSAMLLQLRTRHRFAESGEIIDLAQPRVTAIRILTFLFMFAEMLSRPFLPLYAGSLPSPDSAFIPIPAGMQASLPISCFLLAVALAMPFAGHWSDRLGRRSSFVLGALMMVAGLLLTATLPDFYALLAARSLTGVAYAIMFMACQGFVIDQTRSGNRTQGMASFVSAIMVAEICAPAVGGILADRIGYPLVFISGALIALIAAAAAISILDNTAAPAGEAGKPAASLGQGLASLAKNYRFIALSILTGIPAKLIYSGFLIYLVPTLVTELGGSKSEIGRYTMLYGLSALLLSPLFARLADRYHARNAHIAMVAAGGILTGLGLLPVLLLSNTWTILLGIACLGLGQAMSISAQLVLVSRLTSKEAQHHGPTATLGIFRLIERLGAAAGPAIAAALAAMLGSQQAMAAFGIFGLVSASLFGLLFAIAGVAPAAPQKKTPVGNSAGETP